MMKSLYDLRPILLSVLYLTSGIFAGRFQNVEGLIGDLVVFIAGFIYLVIICIWPITVFVAMNSPDWKLKISFVPMALIFVFTLTVFSMTLKTFFAFDLSFIQESIWGGVFTLMLSSILFLCYASFYPLFLNGKNKWYNKLFAGYVSIVMFVFIPFSVFHIVRKVSEFRELAQSQEPETLQN